MNEELIKVPVVELVYRNNTKPSKRYKIVTAKDVHELLVSPFKDTIEHHISTSVILQHHGYKVYSTASGTL